MAYQSYAYHNNPKFLDRLVLANSADPNQTVPRGEQSDQGPLFALSSIFLVKYLKVWPLCFNFRFRF